MRKEMPAMIELALSSTSVVDCFNLSGRRAVVTGASRGIGKAISVALAARGASVCAVARSSDGLHETCAEAAGLPGSVDPIVADLTDSVSIASMIATAGERLGGLDILVNNAGWDNESDIKSTTLADWRRVMDLNVQAIFLACQAAEPLLTDGGGKVINVSSIFGVIGVRSELAYTTSKHAVIGLTKALALEWARKGVQVNALAPGFVETDMLASATGDEATAAFLRRQTPLGRWAQPEEMVGPIVFLASQASDYMTGQVLVVDGGYTTQ